MNDVRRAWNPIVNFIIIVILCHTVIKYCIIVYLYESDRFDVHRCIYVKNNFDSNGCNKEALMYTDIIYIIHLSVYVATRKKVII